MLKLLLIAAGGVLGTLARYGTVAAMHGVASRGRFPFGTLAVNLVGCFLIGLLQAMFASRWPGWETARAALVVGFLGGYTTFSAYGWEVAEMSRSGRWTMALAYVLISNVVGVALVLAGASWGRGRAG